MRLSSYIRFRLAGQPAPIRKISPEAIRQIAAIGNDLNQLTRWANIYKSASDADLVISELKAIRSALERSLRVEG